MSNPWPRPLSFPMNKAEYISALYHTLASIGHEAATQGLYTRVIPQQVEEKLIHLKTVMEWLNDGNIGFERIEINDEGEIRILPQPPEPGNQFLKSRAEDIKAYPYHKLPVRRREND